MGTDEFPTHPVGSMMLFEHSVYADNIAAWASCEIAVIPNGSDLPQKFLRLYGGDWLAPAEGLACVKVGADEHGNGVFTFFTEQERVGWSTSTNIPLMPIDVVTGEPVKRVRVAPQQARNHPFRHGAKNFEGEEVCLRCGFLDEDHAHFPDWNQDFVENTVEVDDDRAEQIGQLIDSLPESPDEVVAFDMSEVEARADALLRGEKPE